PNGASLSSFYTINHLKILAKIGIFANAKYKKCNANASRISSADSASKTTLIPAETCPKNSSAEAKVFQADR
ncbi:hypothetical protein ACHHRT_13760, partial [Desulfurivibrio sp. D14AmB]|uniref:hypothetical protein n=1 Tax=Desulfurivibrio sp. D14AmB TaxID=3374370 RepID=UPI00376ECB2B